MISAETLREMFALYEGHGWRLRRILASDPNESLDDFCVAVIESEIDAAWFSRPSGDGAVAWEIRYLSNTPFALVEFLDESDPDFEQDLDEVQERLAETIAKRKAA